MISVLKNFESSPDLSYTPATLFNIEVAHMEYIESLLDEYYQLSMDLDAVGGPGANQELFEEISSIEEEICWEISLPVSSSNRGLIRFFNKEATKAFFIQDTIQKLMRAKAKFSFQTEEAILNLFRAA